MGENEEETRDFQFGPGISVRPYVWIAGGRVYDNIFGERLWRAVNYEEVSVMTMQQSEKPENDSVFISSFTIRREFTVP